jgi:hypothetical protein
MEGRQMERMKEARNEGMKKKMEIQSNQRERERKMAGSSWRVSQTE